MFELVVRIALIIAYLLVAFLIEITPFFKVALLILAMANLICLGMYIATGMVPTL